MNDFDIETAGPPGPPGPPVGDGDKGDVVISGGGAVYGIDPALLTAFMRNVTAAADAAAARGLLGLAIGSDVQGYDADLATIAGQSNTAFGLALLLLANAAALRTAAALGSVATLDVDTDGTLAANSDSRIASQKAVRTYVAGVVTGVLKFKNSQDCSGNPNYPAAAKGDLYVVSVAGKIGGASGLSVDVGDAFFATADNAGGTQAAVGASWDLLEHNLAGALLGANNLSDIASAAAARANLGLAIGSDVQGYDADLAAIAALTTTGFGRGVLALADAAALRAYAGNPWTTVVKTADETRQNNATLTADGTLKATLGVGQWRVRIKAFVNAANATMDYKYDTNFTGTATWRARLQRHFVTGAASGTDSEVTTIGSGVVPSTQVTAASFGIGLVEIDAVIDVTVAGEVQFRWAQNTADAGDLSVMEGSTLEYASC